MRAGVRDGVEHDEVAQPLEHVGDEALRVVAALHHLVEQAVHRRRVVGGEGVDDVVEQRVGGDAEQPGGALAGHPVGTGGGQHLVEDRQPVAGRAGGGAHDERAARVGSTAMPSDATTEPSSSVSARGDISRNG